MLETKRITIPLQLKSKGDYWWLKHLRRSESLQKNSLKYIKCVIFYFLRTWFIYSCWLSAIALATASLSSMLSLKSAKILLTIEGQTYNYRYMQTW